MSRRATVILIFACIFTIAALYLLIYRPSIAPWVGVIRRVNVQLEDNPEFEDHLEEYVQIGLSGGNLLNVIEAADPVIGLMDEVDALLDSPAVGALGLAGIPVRAVKELFSTISDGLQELTQAKQELDDLAEMQALADAGRRYRDDSNEKTLRRLIVASDEYENALVVAQERLAWLPPKVDPLNDAMHGLSAVLDQIADRSFPGVSDVAERIRRFLQPIADRLDTFATLLHQYQDQVDRDISTMSDIADVATEVEEFGEQNDIWFNIALKIAGLLP